MGFHNSKTWQGILKVSYQQLLVKNNKGFWDRQVPDIQSINYKLNT